MTEELSEEELRRRRHGSKGYWMHVERSIEANTRNIDNPTGEMELFDEMGNKGFELVQVLPEWRENPARQGIFSNPPIEIKRYTYYFKRWFEYDV